MSQEPQPVDLGSRPARERELWKLALQVARKHKRNWALIGGQMVILHGLARGHGLRRVTRDMDVLVNLRIMPGSLRAMADYVQGDLGFRLQGVSPEGVGHRFEREGLIIDLLVPEGMGERADLGTVGAARAFAVSGGSWALSHIQGIPIVVDGDSGILPVPDLPRALLLKAVARASNEKREKDLEDLAFLLGLVEDAQVLRDALRPKELAYIRRSDELLDAGHDAWLACPDPINGLAVLRILHRKP